MIHVNIDRSEPMPLHDQVAAEIRRAIAEGEAGPGDRLPLVKDIAAVLGVNKNTVLRAMHILRDEGLLEFTRGRGITVSGTPEKSAVLEKVRELMEFARFHGYRREDIIELISGIPWWWAQTMTDKDERLVELAKRLRRESRTTTGQRNTELDKDRWDLLSRRIYALENAAEALDPR
jgi:GntR family transcriptional regulator